MDVKEIRNLMTGLEKSSSTADTLAILNQLKTGVRASEKLLRETKLGIAVNKLRSHPDKKVSETVKTIIKGWKDQVTAQKSQNSSRPSSSSSAAATPVAAGSSASATAKKEPSPAKDESPPAKIASSLSTAQQAAPLKLQQRPANGKPRDSKSDGVKTDLYDDRVRNSCVQVTYNALASDSGAHSEVILACSKEIERTVFQNEKGATPAYRTKMRSLYMNLKDVKNPTLRFRVVAGEISAERLYRMSPQEMASEDLKNEIKRLEEKNLFNAQGAKEQRAITDRFTCGKCKQKKVSYYQMQTRSADEVSFKQFFLKEYSLLIMCFFFVYIAAVNYVLYM
ncbi:transcription factor S-II, central domain-containing protein [Lipomyces japonicus]|uniref:transcription factor S-II, central domain-containing protein n=1 Tax=Lipomyces japonicus TaxID=56871 RepID=UPI0034CFCD6B